MEFLASVSDWLLSLFVFGGIFVGSCTLVSSVGLGRPSKRLACLLEDAPQTALKGQYYEWATPLLTPLACQLEDAPQSSLRGQLYPLATPLACLWQPGWRAFYQQHLKRTGVNYWHWKNLPFSEEVSSQFSQLLSLPQPQAKVQAVLESLASSSPPLWAEDSLAAFRQWHRETKQIIGFDLLQSIYQSCYGRAWDSLAPLLGENPVQVEPALLKPSAHWWQVLGVKPFSPPWQVEQSYKILMRRWHPDLNPHLWATQITAHLNLAYAKYQKHRQIVESALHPWETVKSSVLSSMEKWRNP